MPLERPDSEEAVANLALGKCKEEELATFDDDTHRARVARRHFGLVRDALLRRLDWNFASEDIELAADAEEGEGDFRMRYPVPPDCIMVRRVDGLGDDEWAVRRGTVTIGMVEVTTTIVVCNVGPTIRIYYTRRVDLPTEWDPLFMQAFVCLLAAAMAPELGRSLQQAAGFIAEAEEILVPLAKRTDSREKAPSKVGAGKVPSWIAARGGWWYSRRYP